MVLMDGMYLPSRAIREQVSSAINVIVHQERMRDGTRKIVNITEISGMESEVITMTDIFQFEQTGSGQGRRREDAGAQRRALSDWVWVRVERTSLGSRISQNLARADMKLRVGEYFALIFISMVALGGLAWLIGGRAGFFPGVGALPGDL